MSGIIDIEFVKVMLYKYAKHIWNKLHSSYEGDEKVKREKIQTHKGHFESLNMDEYDIVSTFFLCVDESVNPIKGLNEIIE